MPLQTRPVPATLDGTYAAVCARLPGNGLVAAECRSLTGGTPDTDGVALCHSPSRVSQAAYVRDGVRLLARGDTVDDLVAAVGDLDVAADDFRIEFHAPADGRDLSRRAVTVALADALPYYPDLDDPTHRFLVVVRDTGLWFGEILATADRDYRRHDEKPRRTSASLSARLSRALVNLVASDPGVESVLDPCCGTGSILLEARSLGLRAVGIDWHREMVEMARENAAHFGYDVTVEQADARDCTRRADAVVTDLPYGLTLDADETVVRGILDRAATLAPVAVYVAGDDISAWLAAAGYSEIERYPVAKRAGFARYVHVARSTRVE